MSNAKNEVKVSEPFRIAIESYLQKRAAQDVLFAETLKKPSKNITDCITYILNTVKASGMNGFADDEIYNMAVHYYDEDNIEIGNPINSKVVVNHHVELTEEEIKAAKEQAFNEVVSSHKATLKGTKRKSSEKKEENVQGTLF